LAEAVPPKHPAQILYLALLPRMAAVLALFSQDCKPALMAALAAEVLAVALRVELAIPR
jgi:hypothetical protein